MHRRMCALQTIEVSVGMKALTAGGMSAEHTALPFHTL